MMSAEQFINELESRGWLSEKVLAKVRGKIAGRSLDAESIAQFLVSKGQLTQEQVDQVFDAELADDEQPLVDPLDELPADDELPGDDELPDDDELPEDLGDPLTAGTSESTSVLSSSDGGDSAKKKRRREKRRKDRQQKQNEWDSPLMLIGGGGLILLLLCGAGVYYLLIRGSGDELFKVAQGSFEEESYSQAITQFNQFLEDYTTHESVGAAQVYLGLSLIRQALETANDHEEALKRSQAEIPKMEQTANFEVAQRDLAAILPRIASGLVTKADAAEDLDAINKYVGLTNSALELNLNNKYVPQQYRNKPEIQRAKEILKRIERRRSSLEALKQTLDTMQSAISSGDVRPAYEAHAVLIKEHPELASKPELSKAIADSAMAEQDAVRFIEELISPQTTEPDSPVAAVVATADQRRSGSAPTQGEAVFQFQGVLYGFNAADGALLWRRRVGESFVGATPLLIDNACIAIDARRNELVRIATATGKLQWRVALDDELSQPVVLQDRVLVPSKSGRLHVVQVDSGRRSGYLQFAQPLISAPAVDRESGRVFLVGEHSSVYTLAADDLRCLSVYYLGHAKGAVQAPPATVLGRVLVAENDGRKTSTLHVLALNENGVIDKEVDQIRLKGLSPGSPVVFGRRLATLTDTGHITVYEVSPEDVTAELTEIASRRPPPRRDPTQRYAVLVESHFWVAGLELAKYSINPAGNRLPVLDVKDKFREDVFTSPLIVRGNVLLHARRRRGEAGLTVGATDTKTGQAYWETDVAVPSAGAPSAAIQTGKLIQTTASGRVYSIGVQAGQPSSVATPAYAEASPMNSALQSGALTTDGGLLMSSAGSDWILRVGADAQARWTQLPDSLACEPTRFADGWLAALQVGQVFYISSDPSKSLAVPFQPENPTGPPRTWYPLGASVVDSRPTAVVTNGGNLYTLELREDDPPQVEVLSELELDRPLTTRVAIAAEKAIAGRADGSVAVFDALSLDPLIESEPGPPIVWGPYQVGGQVLLANAAGQLLCYDLTASLQGTIAPQWRQELPTAELIGGPLPTGGSVVLASRNGLLHTITLDEGAVRSIDLKEPLGSQPRLANEQLVVAAADGSVLFVDYR